MSGCNYSFTIEKGEQMAATGPVNQLKTMKKGMIEIAYLRIQ